MSTPLQPVVWLAYPVLNATIGEGFGQGGFGQGPFGGVTTQQAAISQPLWTSWTTD